MTEHYAGNTTIQPVAAQGYKTPDHQLRVIEEKAQLDDRLGKLAVFCAGSFFQTLPQDERERLNRQQVVMATYTMILAERIAAFGGDV